MRFTRYVEALLRVPNIDASTKLVWINGKGERRPAPKDRAYLWNDQEVRQHAELLGKLKARPGTHM